MAFTFKPEEVFSKGIVYAEFFDPATDNLLGYSRYVADFGLAGSMNNGEVVAGPGAALVMMIPDTCRLNVTATTADSALNNMALAAGASIAANGVVETTIAITAGSATLTLTNAVSPLGGQNGAVAYVLTSSGTDRATVEAASGIAHAVDADSGAIQDFEAVANNTYCVKYFYKNSSAMQLNVPSLYSARVVRAHFAVNCYAKRSGNDVLASSLYMIRHYVFPYYVFTNPMEDTLSQTATGTVNLSGTCLTYQEAISEGVCNVDTAGLYGYVVDELVGENTDTALVDGIYFIGLGSGVSLVKDTTMQLPVMYSVNGILSPISDMSQVTFAAASAVVSFEDENDNTMTAGSSAGSTTVTVSVTNSRTNTTYTDTIPVTVTAS
jgi:hypothetical protein